MRLACWPSVSFLFGALFISVISSKLVRLLNHASTVPLGSFVVYMPTFFVLDFLAICLARLLLQQGRTPLAWVSSGVGTFFALIAIWGASSQLAFYLKTGGELQWRDAATYAFDKEALKVLLSGSWAVFAAALVVLAIAWPTHNILYQAVGGFLAGIGQGILSAAQWSAKIGRGTYSRLRDADADIESSSDFSAELDSTSSYDSSDSHTLLGNGEKLSDGGAKSERRCCRYCPCWLVKLIVAVFTLAAIIVRPSKPYDFMTITLPISMLDIFKGEPDFCTEQRGLSNNTWPFPELLDHSLWLKPNGDFKGWAPDRNSALAKKYRDTNPSWLPETFPRGFFRFDPKRFDNGYLGAYATGSEAGKHVCAGSDHRDPYYNPVTDPLRITNLDEDILAPIKGALEDGEVKIKNVILVLMESLREELFPLQQGSGIYNNIMSYNDEEDKERVSAQLAHLTPHIEKITGRPGNHVDAEGNAYPEPELVWDDQTQDGYGGVNVVGAHTDATMSTKSFSSIHCGTWAMPVEKFDEADTDAYQPCLPQILELFNRAKEHKDKDDDEDEDDYHKQEWYPALFESIIEAYDRQEIFDEKLGFKHIVTKPQLEADESRFNKSSPLYHKVNYFGYPETVLAPYVEDYIRNATANKQRIYMSHFTSTTHHAWDTPEDFEDLEYIPTHGVKNKWHKDFNKYINTVRFHDEWMGRLMQILDDTGIANETLVVFAGDHGQAFKEDFHKTGTYENGHVSNFRVPITFRHPHLPRVQYEANATQISVLPTILDLLANSGSLNEKDERVAKDIVQDYEGQSLIRPYRTNQGGRRAWNFAIINSGAGMMAATSADAPWRLVLPLGKTFEYTLSDLSTDPMETDVVSAWSLEELVGAVGQKYGEEAVTWAKEAVPIANWWALERQRLWRYHSDR